MFFVEISKCKLQLMQTFALISMMVLYWDCALTRDTFEGKR
jgi:hypothetical protein